MRGLPVGLGLSLLLLSEGMFLQCAVYKASGAGGVRGKEEESPRPPSITWLRLSSDVGSECLCVARSFTSEPACIGLVY